MPHAVEAADGAADGAAEAEDGDEHGEDADDDEPAAARALGEDGQLSGMTSTAL